MEFTFSRKEKAFYDEVHVFSNTTVYQYSGLRTMNV
jgi:hypothetical protein